MLDRAGSSQLQDGPPSGQAEPVNDGGGASVTTYLRRGKNCCTNAAGREE